MPQMNVSRQSADSTERTGINADGTQCALLNARTCVCLHAGLEHREKHKEHHMQAWADIETVLSHSRNNVGLVGHLRVPCHCKGLVFCTGVLFITMLKLACSV